jgi:hypothetical protein
MVYLFTVVFNSVAVRPLRRVPAAGPPSREFPSWVRFDDICRMEVTVRFKHDLRKSSREI